MPVGVLLAWKSVNHMCAVPTEARSRSPRPGVRDVCEPTCGCLEIKPGFLCKGGQKS